MSVFDTVINKIIKSLAYRAGIQKISIQLDRIENKLDFILQNHTVSPTPSNQINKAIHPTGLPVVFITDHGYLEPTLLAIFSLLRHARSSTVYNVNLVTAGCSEADHKRIRTIFPSINIIQADIPKHKIQSQSHVTLTALLKFDLPALLPHLDKVLYLDGDILVRSDLAEVIKTSLSDNFCAAVKDCKAIFEKYPQRFKIPVENNYFNSGVLLLNLSKMRKLKISEKLWEVRLKIQSHFVDQDCFNIVLGKNVYLLPLSCNVMAQNIALANLSTSQLAEIYEISSKQVAADLKSPRILHYSSPKPWNSTATLGYEYFCEDMKLFKLYQQENMSK